MNTYLTTQVSGVPLFWLCVLIALMVPAVWIVASQDRYLDEVGIRRRRKQRMHKIAAANMKSTAPIAPGPLSPARTDHADIRVPMGRGVKVGRGR